MNDKKTSSLQLPQVLESRVVFEESILKIKKDLLKVNHEPPYPYYSLVTRPASVIVLAVTPEGKYICNEEYRQPVGKSLLCFPGGFIDDEESILDAAKRELSEETGYKAESYEVIGSAYPYAGMTGQKVYYVKASGATYQAPARPETSEIFQTHLLTAKEIHEAVERGVLIDGTLATALFFLFKNQILTS